MHSTVGSIGVFALSICKFAGTDTLRWRSAAVHLLSLDLPRKAGACFVFANGEVLKISNVSSDRHKRGNGFGENGHHDKN
jgi:hypothetical protein